MTMGQTDHLDVEFVEFVPDELEDGRLYVSIEHTTAVHRCACGCGTEVVTPLSPVGWSLTFDGEAVSLAPSIGNWKFECQSHYWIRQGRVVWAPRWSQERIEAGRAADNEARRRHFKEVNSSAPEDAGFSASHDPGHAAPNGWLHKTWRWFRERI